MVNGESGPPLGLVASEYRDRTVELQRGAKLLFYSDGISESADADDQEFGSIRIGEHMLQVGSSAESLLKAASAHSYSGEPSDDATVIVLRCAEAR